MELNEFLDKAYAVLRRLDAVLPPEPGHTDWNALAFRWQSAGKKVFGTLARSARFPFVAACRSRQADRIAGA